jgi:hypothetical protein
MISFVKIWFFWNAGKDSQNMEGESIESLGNKRTLIHNAAESEKGLGAAAPRGTISPCR